MQLYGSHSEANACPCCTRCRTSEREKQRALKKRARRTARTEIEYALHDMWLEELGVETFKEALRSAKERRAYELQWALRYSGYDASGQYDPYNDWDFPWHRSAYEETYDDGYGDRWYDRYEYEYDRYPEYADPREAGWLGLWLSGRVHTPMDVDELEYDAWLHEGYADHYPYCPDYDSPNFEGEGEFWSAYARSQEPATPATISITREREREKLKAGNRYYRATRRAA
jgi:hypothetical protein